MTKNAGNGPTWNLVSITPNFIVKNLQASIVFYVERLGFHVDYQGPDDGPSGAKSRAMGSASTSRKSIPTSVHFPIAAATHGLPGTRTSPRWTRTRSSTSSTSAVCHL